MPTRTLWCRHPDCLKPTEAKAGFLPKTCPKCEKDALWTVLAPSEQFAQTVEDVRLLLSFNDRRFLRSLRIKPPEDEPDDGA